MKALRQPLGSSIEPLEARIAPAVVIGNPLPNLVAGVGKTGATVDLSHLVEPASTSAYHTEVQFTTNFDTDPMTPGLQAGIITFELYDDTAPLTVQNFLNYVESKNARGDYLGTFFHRASPVPPVNGNISILQGGGYEAATPSLHIPVGLPLHNEPDVTNRPNVAGTVAMARLGFDVNSATSEFFINLADNPNLDAQGFTVFAKVAQGLDVADKIANLPYYHADASGFGTPVQNYNPDPDNNPSTPPPAPTPSQLITITGVKVIPPAHDAATGLTYSVHAYQPGTTTPSDIVSASVTDSTLNLKYASGKSGRADVVVTVSNGTDTATNTFHVDDRDNLIATLPADPLTPQLVPGDASAVKVNISNNGSALASGKAKIEIYLAKLQKTVDANGQITSVALVDPLDQTPIGVLDGAILNIASGSTQPVTVNVQIPTKLAATDGDLYRLAAIVVPESGTLTNERFSDDNTALNGGNHELRNAFGTVVSSDGFGTRTGVALKLAGTDALGHPTQETWSLLGPGEGLLSKDSAGGLQLGAIGTNLSSTLTAALSAGSAHAVLGGAQLSSAVGAVNLGALDLKGYFAASGGLKSLTLGNLTGEGLVLIGAVAPDNSTKAVITFGRVKDFSLQSDMPIASLTATEWTDTAGTPHDTISAPSLGALRITGGSGSRGDLGADVRIDDGGLTSAITVAGLVQGSTISTTGSIGAVTVGGIAGSNLFAGVTQRPQVLADFTSNQTISSFTVAGIKGYSGALFSDTQVAAQTLGAIKVMGVDGSSGSGDFGFIADVIQSYSRVGGPTASGVKDPKVIERLGNYVAETL